MGLEILKRDNADVNSRGDHGRGESTPLLFACTHELIDVALQILKRDNLDVNAKTRCGEKPSLRLL